jgi:hypothetical protein
MMEGLVSNLATRISKSNFRNAVEINLLTRVLASNTGLNRAIYEKLRATSIHDVKTLNGSIDIYAAANEAKDDT